MTPQELDTKGSPLYMRFIDLTKAFIAFDRSSCGLFQPALAWHLESSHVIHQFHDGMRAAA